MTVRIAAGFCFTVLALFAVSFAQEAPRGRSEQSDIVSVTTHGPYTVYVLSQGVYRIEDANESNPAGMVVGDDGQIVHMNNCSDMYLVVGKEKALLIDLSNDVKWDGTAAESLRAVVYERTGNRELLITVTHNHGDHLGMLPVFADDRKASFRIPEAEFKGKKIFPEDCTIYFPEKASLDLGGGVVLDTLEVPGHTPHSTLFFLRGRNMVFSGDAVGSGSGVWLFNYESFSAYRDGVDRLVAFIENPVNHIDPGKLEIHGGHAWQREKIGKLTGQYVYDMRTLIERIASGTAESEAMSAPLPFLDINFEYGIATITWNKAAAERYAESVRAD